MSNGYSIQDLKTDLAAVSHGTTTNQIVSLDAMINRAARTLLLDIDPQETIRIQQFVNPIYNQVFDYALPSDLKGNKVIDIRPQVNRLPQDIFTQGYNQAFDVAKGNVFSFADQFTINFNTAVKTIRINAPTLPVPIVINQAESITANGTWSLGGNATSLSVNNTNFVSSAGSLQFNLTTSGTTGTITNSTSSSVDLSNYTNQGTFFFYTYLPSGTAITSMQLKIGSSSSNYYTATATVNQQGNAFVRGWNLIAYNWATMTTVGSPNSSALTYIQITYTTDGTLQTAVLLDNVTFNLGQVLEIEYYSKYVFRDAITGAFQEKVTDNSNQINLDVESYNLLFSQVAYLSAQQLQGLDAQFFDANYWLQQYQIGKDRYMSLYKSQLQKPQSIYYGVPNTKYSRYLGRGWQ